MFQGDTGATGAREMVLSCIVSWRTRARTSADRFWEDMKGYVCADDPECGSSCELVATHIPFEANDSFKVKHLSTSSSEQVQS